MAMIDAKDAKKLLGCDDATLNNHINSGALRAQRAGGRLMVEQDDVEKLVSDKDDEGTGAHNGNHGFHPLGPQEYRRKHESNNHRDWAQDREPSPIEAPITPQLVVPAHSSIA